MQTPFGQPLVAARDLNAHAAVPLPFGSRGYSREPPNNQPGACCLNERGIAPTEELSGFDWVI